MDTKSYVTQIYALRNDTLTAAERKAAVEKLEADILGVEDPDGKLKATKCGLIQTLYSAMGMMPWKWNEKQVVIAQIRHKCRLPIHDSMKVALGLMPAPTPNVNDVNAELAAA